MSPFLRKVKRILPTDKPVEIGQRRSRPLVDDQRSRALGNADELRVMSCPAF